MYLRYFESFISESDLSRYYHDRDLIFPSNFRTGKLTQNFFERANPRRRYPPTYSRSLFRRVKSVYKAVPRSYGRSYVEEMTETRGGRAEFADGRHIAKFNSSMCRPITRITSGGTTTRTTRTTKTAGNER